MSQSQGIFPKKHGFPEDHSAHGDDGGEMWPNLAPQPHDFPDLSGRAFPDFLATLSGQCRRPPPRQCRGPLCPRVHV